MATSLSTLRERRLARQAREKFISIAIGGLPALSEALQEFLTALMMQVGTQREMQGRRDAWTFYQQHRTEWAQRIAAAWQQSLAPLSSTSPGPLEMGGLQLVGDDVVENKIIASRIGMAAMEKTGEAFEALRALVQDLEQEELSPRDLLRPETMAMVMVEQWVESGLQRADVPVVLEPLQRELAQALLKGYTDAKAFLVAEGITPNNDLRSRVRRTTSAPLSGVAGNSASGAVGPRSSRGDSLNDPDSYYGDTSRDTVRGGPASTSQRESAQPGNRHTAHQVLGAPSGPAPDTGQHAGGFLSPLSRARGRAQGVIGHIKRLLTDVGTSFVANVAPMPQSEELSQALAPHRSRTGGMPSGGGTLIEDYSSAGVERVATQLRHSTTELKKKASTQSEKATIEIVALMFQSILVEERIPPSVRVWFARLQLPVLRLALSEPEFFGTLDHPARQLIDRMGSCVMGFDTSSANGVALDAEIRRVVQVIEQYPETGRRVFQLVYDEFKTFLAKFLTETTQATSRVASVAQQVELKETLAIQYTIELRNMLRDVPVRDEIREFLFKVWAEALALSAVRDGPQHAETIAYKRAASDLLWAASAKPHRSDRARVIQDLPKLLARLRMGMVLLNISGSAQDAHIKILSDTLADAFLSKTAAIPQERIEAMASRLANLEDFISDEAMEDLPLDTDSIEMMLGMDVDSIHVVADNGMRGDDATLEWALELQTGTWFTLDHNSSVKQVQYAWCSERRQLHLFAAFDGSCYLIQLRRMAAYLQTGLLVPQEDEALTLRATRTALAKLEANPERLLG